MVIRLSATLLLLSAAGAACAQRPPSPVDIDAYTGLLAAAATGDVEAVESALAGGADPDVRDSQGRPPSTWPRSRADGRSCAGS